MASRTRARVASSTLAWPFDTRDTVCEETPARRATSAIDGRGVTARPSRVDVMGSSLVSNLRLSRHVCRAVCLRKHRDVYANILRNGTGTTPMAVNSAVAASARAAPRRRVRRARGRTRWAGWAFVGPFLVVFAFALIVPIGYAIYLSLFREQLIGGNAFVGLSNYKIALGDPQFWASLRRMLLFLAVQVPIMTVLALLAALALDSARLRWAPLYRLSLLLPYALAAVVASLMWGFIYGSQFGLVARVRSFFGGHFPDPFSSNWVLTSIG